MDKSMGVFVVSLRLSLVAKGHLNLFHLNTKNASRPVDCWTPTYPGSRQGVQVADGMYMYGVRTYLVPAVVCMGLRLNGGVR